MLASFLEIPELSNGTLAAVAALTLVASVVSLAVYRLYLHPLARFPGRKLAAVTLWYEFYYDVIKRGRYAFEIQKMHEEYGPIVRINPHELHINDPEYFDYLYSTLKLDKYARVSKQFGNPESTLATTSHDLHRLRRAAIAPFFTRAKVLQLINVVWSKLDKLCDRLSQSNGTPVDLACAYRCYATDVVTEYYWAKSYNFLDHPKFNADWFVMMRGIAEAGHMGRMFPWLMPLMMSLPQWFAVLINPLAAGTAALLNSLADQVKQITKVDPEEFKGKPHKTIFHELHSSTLPPRERTPERLSQEGMLLLFAGFDTTGNALAVTTYHLLSNPDKLERLRKEIEPLMLANDGKPIWTDLEKLPYLTAVITEGLRLSSISGRFPRLAPKQGLQFHNWHIPSGTPVSMNAYLMHDNESIFPDARSFKPERWLSPDAAQLQKYFVPFTKGPRQCLGMHLAYAEIYLALATVLWRFPNMELYETTRADVDVAHDFLLPYPVLDSKGVRVLVK